MPNKLFKTHPAEYGKGSRDCILCYARQGLIRKYDMNLCRKCFRDNSEQIGFHKVT